MKYTPLLGESGLVEEQLLAVEGAEREWVPENILRILLLSNPPTRQNDTCANRIGVTRSLYVRSTNLI